MKVRELIKILRKMDQKKEVILQIDLDGNGYKPLGPADEECVYTYDYDVYSTDWTADEACMDEQEWIDFKKNNKGCVVLAPLY